MSKHEEGRLFDPDKAEALSYIRGEVMRSLELYLLHMKYTVGLMSSMVAVALALVAFSADHDEMTTICTAAAVILLVSVFPVSRESSKIVRRFYKIYACNYIYSARAHKAANPDFDHPWNTDLFMSKFFPEYNSIDGSNPNPIDTDEAVERFLNYGRWNSPFTLEKDRYENHSWYHYKRLIHGMGWISATAGFALLVVTTTVGPV